MKKIILLILLSLFLVPFVLALEKPLTREKSYLDEFTLAIGEEKAFPEQDIRVELTNIQTDPSISGYTPITPSGYGAYVNGYIGSEERPIYGRSSKLSDQYYDSRSKMYLYPEGIDPRGYTKVKIELVSLNLEQATFRISEENIGGSPEMCLEECLELNERRCNKYPDSPVCLNPRYCEARCTEKGENVDYIIFLNEIFPLRVGEKAIIEDYDNTEIELLSIDRSECTRYSSYIVRRSEEPGDWYYLTDETGEVIKYCSVEKQIYNLRVKKNNEVKLLNLVFKEQQLVFDVRIELITDGTFGVYEKGVRGWWARITEWFSLLFS